jgi:hypothetical protein
MSDEYTKCTHEFTNRHHENIGNAVTREDHQELTCQLLDDTVKCAAVLKRCHTTEELERTKDGHILARINQYADNQDGINIKECPIAKDYIESGKGDEVDETTIGACTHSEASVVQTDFGKCSHQLNQNVWADIQELEKKTRKEQGIPDKETNDILEEEQRQDEVQWNLTELKNLLCMALQDIGDKCRKVITRCFKEEDVQQMVYNHVKQMEEYYAGIYTKVELSDCPALSLNPCDRMENGEYVDCDEPDNPTINPPPPDDYEEEIITQSPPEPGTSKNIQAPTTLSPTTAPPTPNNVVKEPVNPTKPEDKDMNNGDNTEQISPAANTQSDGYCNKATYILVALTSVILANLCN